MVGLEIEIASNVYVEAPRNNPLVFIANANRVQVHDNVVQSFSNEEDAPDDNRHDHVPSPPPLLFVQEATSVSGAGNRCAAGATPPSPRPSIGSAPDGGGTVTATWPCP